MSLISLSEYARRTGKDPGNIRRMIYAGRLQGQKIGNQWVIEEDTPYPVDNRVKSGEYRNWRKHMSFNSNKDIAGTVRRLVKELSEIYGQYLDRIVLYGSYARCEQTEESDVDIALMLNAGHNRDMYNRMIDCVADRELDCGKVLSVIDIDTDKYETWKSTLPFYRNIDREGILLWKQA